MGLNILLEILSGILALGVGGISTSGFTQKLVRRVFGIKEKKEKSYSERLTQFRLDINN